MRSHTAGDQGGGLRFFFLVVSKARGIAFFFHCCQALGDFAVFFQL